MNRALLLLALAAAIPARAADKDFKPIKASESVTYPLPPIPLPAVQPADGKWAETEDSPALRVSRAWVKLGQAAGVERSEATRRLYQAWKNEVAQNGPHGRVAQAAHAKFLAAYKKDLDQARAIYEGVLRDVDSMDADGAEASGPEGAVTGGLAREAEEQIRGAARGGAGNGALVPPPGRRGRPRRPPQRDARCRSIPVRTVLVVAALALAPRAGAAAVSSPCAANSGPQGPDDPRLREWLRALVHEVAHEEGVDPHVLEALGMTETALQPALGRACEVGPFQVMPWWAGVFS